MSPLRWDVLGVAFLLALPVLAMGLRGDLALQDVMTRLPWCFAAGWGAVALLRWAAQPRGSAPSGVGTPEPIAEPEDLSTAP